MLLSAESPFVGALAFHIRGATLLHRNGLVRAVLPASTEHVQTDIGDPQELGRSSRLVDNLPAGATGDQLQASAVHSSAEERTQRVAPRYRQTKVTKYGGMGGRKS